MKALSIWGLILFMITCSCVQQEPKFPQGTWQLVQWLSLSGDSITKTFPGEWTGSDIVIFSERHMLSVGLLKKDTVTLKNGVGVSYTLDGNHLEETILYFPNPEYVGKKVKQILEMRGDTLFKSYPCDENWELIKSSYIIEKYIRLK